MKKNSSVRSRDFREFAFIATGTGVDPESITAIDLLDNLSPELDRLHTLADLLSSVNDEIDAGVASGLALLLKDVERRSRCILEAFDRCRSRARDKP